MSIPKKQKEAVATALSHELRRKRRDKELTQAELAEKAEVHQTYVSQLERGVNVPSIDVVFALCDALETEAGPFLQRVKRLAEEYRNG
jgi:transcriptional regulator with XRE-family HTH domain